jgi:hypothetical protein
MENLGPFADCFNNSEDRLAGYMDASTQELTESDIFAFLAAESEEENDVVDEEEQEIASGAFNRKRRGSDSLESPFPKRYSPCSPAPEAELVANTVAEIAADLASTEAEPELPMFLPTPQGQEEGVQALPLTRELYQRIVDKNDTIYKLDGRREKSEEDKVLMERLSKFLLTMLPAALRRHLETDFSEKEIENVIDLRLRVRNRKNKKNQ